MTSIDKLRADAEKAEQAAQKLMADKDAALQKVRDQYTERLQDANDEAAAAQKRLCDLEVALDLAGQEDGPRDAKRLVAEGGLSREAVEAAGITLPE